MNTELLKQVRDHAVSHYNDGGLDVIVEAYTDEELAEAIGNSKTLTGALRKLAPIVAINADRQREAKTYRDEPLGDDGTSIKQIGSGEYVIRVNDLIGYDDRDCPHYGTIELRRFKTAQEGWDWLEGTSERFERAEDDSRHFKMEGKYIEENEKARQAQLEQWNLEEKLNPIPF